MGRLIAFLATSAFVGLLASVFQVPNMIPLMLIIFWIAMGCGLRIWWGIIGAVFMPFTIALPMSLLPGPEPLHHLVPPNDGRFVEFYYVSGALELHEEALAEFQPIHAQFTAGLAAGTKSANDVPLAPRLHESNIAAAEAFAAGRADGTYRVWPTTSVFVVGLVITILASIVNTVTSGPFRDARPLGQP